ncbi:MAG TPA: aldolase/citrate lyase family protein [Anaerolineae bacterium]|nr:aldolase/citrate lyase family protein [Anaerolineae bacterium]
MTFRQRLKDHETLVGTIISLASPEAAEVLSQAGFDWLFLEAEHAPLNTLTIQHILQGAGSTPCLVRVAASAEVEIKQALDAGAAGIIAPLVNTADQATQVVHWAKYAPLGTRGVGVSRAHGYGFQFQEYMSNANDETVVVVQAEHSDAVNNMASIVQVPGVDAVLVGPYDLSASLGHIGEVTHPHVVSAIEHVTQVCRAAHMPLGIFGMTAEAVRPYIERGYTLLAASIDTVLLGTAARQLLAQLKR